MFNFKRKKGGASKPDIKMAAATLMFAVIKSDGMICKSELVAMAKALRDQFGLSEEDLNSLIFLAHEKKIDDQLISDVARDVCSNWGNARRMKLLENLWTIALADQRVDPEENSLVRKLANLLCLNEMQIFQTQENAREQLGILDF